MARRFRSPRRTGHVTACWVLLALGCGAQNDAESDSDTAPNDTAEASDAADPTSNGSDSETSDTDASGDDSEGADGSDADDDTADGASDEMPTQDGSSADDDTNADDAIQPDVADCGVRTLPSQPLRRLSSHEYQSTLADLFGEDLAPRVANDSLFPETLIRSGFSTNAEANIVNTAESNAIEDEAQRIAEIIDEDPDPFLRGLMPCDLPEAIVDADIDDCVEEFVAQFGLRAYRRPLTASETALARGAYDAVRESGSARFAWSGLVQYFVQAPAFLYRVERGAPVDGEFLVPLTNYERATRLAFFLTGSTPDAELLSAAESGELSGGDQVRVQAERLLTSERFGEVLERFHREWLERHDFEWKPPELFPDFDAARGSLNREQGEFVRYVLEQADGRISTLLGSSTYPVNATLAGYYGVEAPDASDEDWVPVEVPNRRGLLSQASLMATLAGSEATNPIHRGAFMQTQVLCRTLPALPGDVDIQTPLQDTSDLPTARQRLAPLLERGECSGCHTLINPMGLAFENYDAAGLWRDQENGTEIDASGSLDLDGAGVDFADPIELLESIASSRTAQECYATQWFRAGLGRLEFAEDACSLAPLHAATAETEGDIRAMLLALVQTDAFLFKAPVTDATEEE